MNSRETFPTHSQMVKEVRKYLMDVCKHNLQCRWKLWAEIINEETDKINEKLFGETSDDIFEEKLCKKEIQIITKFIKNWHGLKIPEASKRPTHPKQYKEKARSWLNGRRAMQYSRHLYPVMLKKAEKFTIKLADNYFESKICEMDNYDKIRNNTDCINNLKQKYTKILISSYIVKLCQEKMTLNNRSKKVYLLTPNAIKSKKSKTREALQQFADECDEKSDEYKGYMPYYKEFPSHRSIAKDYFDKKSENTLNELLKKLKKLNDEEMKMVDILDNNDDAHISEMHTALIIDHSSSDSLPSSYHPQLQQNKSNSKSISMEYPSSTSTSPLPSSPSLCSTPIDSSHLDRVLKDIGNTEHNGRVLIQPNQWQFMDKLIQQCLAQEATIKNLVTSIENISNLDQSYQSHSNYGHHNNESMSLSSSLNVQPPTIVPRAPAKPPTPTIVKSPPKPPCPPPNHNVSSPSMDLDEDTRDQTHHEIINIVSDEDGDEDIDNNDNQWDTWSCNQLQFSTHNDSMMPLGQFQWPSNLEQSTEPCMMEYDILNSSHSYNNIFH